MLSNPSVSASLCPVSFRKNLPVHWNQGGTDDLSTNPKISATCSKMAWRHAQCDFFFVWPEAAQQSIIVPAKTAAAPRSCEVEDGKSMKIHHVVR